jgi:hypothetical protein
MVVAAATWQDWCLAGIEPALLAESRADLLLRWLMESCVSRTAGCRVALKHYGIRLDRDS